MSDQHKTTELDAKRARLAEMTRNLVKENAALRLALHKIAGDQPSATGCNPQLMRDIARKALGL